VIRRVRWPQAPLSWLPQNPHACLVLYRCRNNCSRFSDGPSLTTNEGAIRDLRRQKALQDRVGNTSRNGSAESGAVVTRCARISPLGPLNDCRPGSTDQPSLRMMEEEASSDDKTCIYSAGGKFCVCKARRQKPIPLISFVEIPSNPQVARVSLKRFPPAAGTEISDAWVGATHHPQSLVSYVVSSDPLYHRQATDQAGLILCQQAGSRGPW